MNIFAIAVITMFFLASGLEAYHQKWLLCVFYALSGLINVVVAMMGK